MISEVKPAQFLFNLFLQIKIESNLEAHHDLIQPIWIRFEMVKWGGSVVPDDGDGKEIPKL